MFFSSLLILLFHLWINIFERTSNFYNIETFIRQTLFIGVDIFFFLSSYSISTKEIKDYKTFLIKRFKKIYIPFIIFALIALFYLNWNIKTFILNITGINLLIKGGGSFLWFIPAIMIVYILLPLYNKIDKKYKITPLVTLTIWLLLTIIVSKYTLYKSIFIFTNRIPIILIGYYFAKLDIFNKLNKKIYIILTTILLITGMLLTYKLRFITTSYIIDIYYLYSIPLTIGLILFLDLIKTNKITNLLGSITLELYGVQMIFGYNIAAFIYNFINIKLLSNLLTITVVILISIMTNIVLKKLLTKIKII